MRHGYGGGLGQDGPSKRTVDEDDLPEEAVDVLAGAIVRAGEGIAREAFRSPAARAAGLAVHEGIVLSSASDRRELLSEPQRKAMGEWIAAARSFPAESPFSDPTTFAAVTSWFALSAKAQLSRRPADFDAERLRKLEGALVTRASLQEDTSSEGGYLVPTIVEPEVLRLVKDAGLIFPRGRQVPMRSKVTKVPNEATAVTIYWVEEEGALTQGEPVFGETTLTAEKIAGRAKFSLEVLQDSAPGLLSYLLEVFSEKIAGELDKQMVLGDGSGPQITGIMSASGINAITSATATGRALTYPLLVSTFCGAGESQPRADGVWICSPKGYEQILNLVDSNGTPIVQFGNVPNAPAGTILGRPIIVSNRIGGAGTLDDATNTCTKIVFGPLNALLCGTRMGMRWDVTDQVGWANFQADCRLVGRFAGNVGVPSAFTYLGQVDYT